jgi:cytochrome c oxidase subunit 2
VPIAILREAALMQSVLAPHGPEAQAVATLGWTMFAGAALICLAIAALVVLAIRGGAGARRVIAAERFVVASGIVLPIAVLAGLLAWGLVLTGGRVAPPSPGALAIEVVGEQWWWRVRYEPSTERAVETANELRIPAGSDVELRLVSRDVIHSFWVPSLAGKVDMIPGTVNRLRLRANAAGTWRGQCAEYCGGPHALMSFHVVALDSEGFDAWLARQRRPAGPTPESPAGDAARAGRSVFFKAGCNGCHTVRGTEAAGTIGPDLTHVAGRLTLGAATLPTGPANFGLWVREHQRLKPGNRMPVFGFLPASDVELLANWLASLE